MRVVQPNSTLGTQWKAGLWLSAQRSMPRSLFHGGVAAQALKRSTLGSTLSVTPNPKARRVFRASGSGLPVFNFPETRTSVTDGCDDRGMSL
jgi:hypothetical protein